MSLYLNPELRLFLKVFFSYQRDISVLHLFSSQEKKNNLGFYMSIILKQKEEEEVQEEKKLH